MADNNPILERRKKKPKSPKHHVERASDDELKVKEDRRERRRCKEAQREESRVRKLAELGLGTDGKPLDNYSILQYPVRECKFTFLKQTVAFNPVVTTVGLVVVWGIVLQTTGEHETSFISHVFTASENRFLILTMRCYLSH